MKKLILAVSLCTLPLLIAAAPSASQGKDDAQAISAAAMAAREKKVRQLLDLTGSGKMGEQVISRLVMQFERMPQLPDGYIAKFKELAKPAELIDLIVPIYARNIDEKDLDGIIQFFKTDVGKRWMAAQAEIQRESMAANQKWTRDLHKRVMKALKK